MISLLLTLGFSEATAIAIVGSRWIRRVVAVFAAAGLLIGVAWFLTHLGGEWRQAAIERAWSAKFAAVTNESRRLAIARQRASLDVEAAVKAAIDALPAPAPPAMTVHVTKCEPPVLPADAVRKLNRIR